MKTIITTAIMVLCLVSASVVFAKSKSISGKWKGGGSFISAAGSKERTRCRATIRARKARSFSVYAKCAIASLGTIEQTGRVKRVGKNRYAGRFNNEEYDIRGSIYISLRGNRQYITMRSPEGSGHLVLRRQR